METFGYDFSWFKPDPVAVKNAGGSFVFGYISHDPGKDLINWQQYANAGLSVGMFVEFGSNRVLSGAAGGSVDGEYAESICEARSYPVTAPLIVPVDYDAPSSDYAAIMAYGTAFNLATRRPIGIYGSYNVIEHFVTPNVQPFRYGVQTAAWSGTNLSQKANVYQRNHYTHKLPAGVPSGQVDEDVLCRLLPLAGAAVPTPTRPTPQPAPQPLYYSVRSGDTLTSIAAKYHTTVRNLLQLNRIPDPNHIIVNQNIRVR